MSIPTLWAQDIHFSQYQASPLTLNPAETGDYDADWRVMNSFRTQWRPIANPFNTNALAYDRQFRELSTDSRISGGIAYIHDESGIVRLNTDKLYLSAAYHTLLKGHSLHIGYQLGFVNKRVNVGDLSFPNQFNYESGVFDNELPNGETNLRNSIFYLDMNVGVEWRRKFGAFTPKLGFALFHFNRPRESFNGEKGNVLANRKMFNVGFAWDISKRIRLNPDVLLQLHNGASELVMGSDITFFLGKKSSGLSAFFLGAAIRNDIDAYRDAMIATIGLHVKNVRVGFSYDVNVSDLESATDQQGAYELSLIYMKRKYYAEQIQIPCDRL